MTERQILLVKESWSHVVLDSEKAGQLFYQRLFDVSPGIRHMFKSEPGEQARKLMNMVTLIVAKLEKLDDIMNEIKSLSQRHGKYGAKPEHYQVVGACLLWTLEQSLDDKWNSETAEAWTAVYGLLSNAMIKNQTVAIL